MGGRGSCGLIRQGSQRARRKRHDGTAAPALAHGMGGRGSCGPQGSQRARTRAPGANGTMVPLRLRWRTDGR